mgnify:CR=1 FL=1
MANALNDGLSKPDQIDVAGIQASEIEAGTITQNKLAQNFTGSVDFITTGKVQAANFEATGSAVLAGTLSSSQVLSNGSVIANDKVCLVHQGSTPLMIQTGSATTGAGSDVTVPFNTAFSAAPIQLSLTKLNADLGDLAGSVLDLGSFYVVSEGANKLFSWIAIGPV